MTTFYSLSYTTGHTHPEPGPNESWWNLPKRSHLYIIFSLRLRPLIKELLTATLIIRMLDSQSQPQVNRYRWEKGYPLPPQFPLPRLKAKEF